jgi:hypothetical protein
MPKSSRRLRRRGPHQVQVEPPPRARRNVPISEYAPPNTYLDTLSNIPILNMLVPYLIFPVLRLILRFGDWLLANWRTEDQAVSEFLSLGSRAKPVMFHLHVGLRKSIEGPEDSAFCMGLDVAYRKPLFIVPTETTSTASELIPQIIKELCQSIIRGNHDDPLLGKPVLITTPDYMLYFEFVKKFQKHDITVLRKHDSEVMLGRPDAAYGDPVPLSAVTDSIATTIDRDSALILQGEDLPQAVAETFRRSKNQPGLSRSTVKKENEVPPSIEFCCHCGKLYLRNEVMRCGKCGFPAYCSNKCQKGDWNDHRQVCKHLKLVKEQGGFL